MPNDAVTRENLSRTDKFTVALFSIFGALVVLPGLALAAIAILSTGSIDLGH